MQCKENKLNDKLYNVKKTWILRAHSAVDAIEKTKKEKHDHLEATAIIEKSNVPQSGEEEKYYWKDFSESDIEAILTWIENMFIGLAEMKARPVAREYIEKLKRHEYFTGEDQFNFTYTISTIANDLLAAVGWERKKNRQKENLKGEK